jgi:hypothetical protein
MNLIPSTCRLSTCQANASVCLNFKKICALPAIPSAGRLKYAQKRINDVLKMDINKSTALNTILEMASQNARARLLKSYPSDEHQVARRQIFLCAILRLR